MKRRRVERISEGKGMGKWRRMEEKESEERRIERKGRGRATKGTYM